MRSRLYRNLFVDYKKKKYDFNLFLIQTLNYNNIKIIIHEMYFRANIDRP